MHKLLYKHITPIFLLAMLSACLQSNIQSDYTSVSDGCRTQAETQATKLAPAKNAASRNAELVALFSGCMASKGWAVATPQREKGPSDTIANNSFSNNPNSEQIPQNNGRPTPTTSAYTGRPAPTPAPAPAPAQSASPAPVTSQYPQQAPAYSVYQPAYPTPPADVAPPATGQSNNASGFSRF